MFCRAKSFEMADMLKIGKLSSATFCTRLSQFLISCISENLSTTSGHTPEIISVYLIVW